MSNETNPTLFEMADGLLLNGGKRCGIQQSEWLGPDWFTSWSPRNDNTNAEGMWCHWVHLARRILAHPLTEVEMPDHFVPYDPGESHYDDHHRDCTRAIKSSDPEEMP